MITATNPASANPALAMLGRDLSLWRKILPGILIFVLIFGALCGTAAVSMTHGTESGYLAAPVALVNQEDTDTGKFAVRMISSQDFAAPISIVQCTAAEAEEGLRDGSFSAVVYLPQGYLSGVMHGDKTQVKIVLSENAELHSSIVRLLSEFGEELLSAGQFGVFAGENLVLREDPQKYEAFMTEVNLLYLNQAMSDRWFIRQETSYGGTGVTAAQWYVLLYTSLFFQLAALVYLPFRRDLTVPLARRLRSSGIRDSVFAGSKLLYMMVSSLLIAVPVAAWLGATFTVKGVLCALAGLLLTNLVGLGLDLCLPKTGAAALITALAGVELFAAGGIIPRVELPAAITGLGEFFPLTITARLFSALLGESPSVKDLGLALCWMGAAWAGLKLRLCTLRKGVQP